MKELPNNIYFPASVSCSMRAFMEQVSIPFSAWVSNAVFSVKKTIWIWLVLLIICQGMPAIAQPTPAQMRDSLQKAGNDSSRLKWYILLFRHFEYTNSDSALRYSEKGINEFENSDYLYGQAEMWYMQGWLYNEKRMFALATNSTRTALNLYMATGKQSLGAEMYGMLGNIEVNRGRYNEAIRHMFRAARIAEQIKDSVVMASTYLNLGVAYIYMDDTTRALQYFKKGLSLRAWMPPENQVYMYNNIGDLYLSKKDYRNAYLSLTRGLQLARDSSLTQCMINPLLNLGKLYAETHRTKEALKSYTEALKTAEKIGLPSEQVQALTKIGKLQAHQYPLTAIKYYQQALAIANKNELPTRTIVVLAAMIAVYKQTGNYKRSLELTEQRQVLQDSLFSIEKAKEIADLESVYKLEISQKEVKSLYLARKRDLKQFVAITIVTIILSVLLIGAIFFYRRSVKLNHQLSNSMDSLRLSEERLRISNNLKEQYYSLLSHDLKSPLKYLRLALETLRDNIHKYSPAAIEKRLHGLYKSTDKIYGLTENFTSWIRAHDSSVKTEPVAVNIPHLLKNIAALYEHMEQTQIKIDAGERLIFCTDPNLMHIVFRNVVDNALKHGNATAIHIRAQEHVDNTLQVRFSNNGHCIPPETLARLNDDTLVPEMQAINNQQSLGYQIIKALTLKLEGTHHISSTHENGTDITFIFKALKSHL